MPSTSVAVTVATHNRNGPLAVLLDALVHVAESAASLAQVGVVVIDDNPDGRAARVCSDFADRYPLGLSYVHVGSENIAVARNAALSEGMATADWVALIDDDCVPAPGWLDELIAMQRATNADIVTGSWQMRAPEAVPDWFVAQGFLRAPELYEDGSEPPYGSTANALIRSRFLADHPDVRFRADYGHTGGEDMVFFHAAKAAGAVHRYARNALVIEEVPLHRTRYRYRLTKSFWFGNNMVVINRTTREFPHWRLFGRGVRRVLQAAVKPMRRIVAGQPPHFRRAVVEAATGVGLVAGVLGVTARHH